jgi:hypothetical protein
LGNLHVGAEVTIETFLAGLLDISDSQTLPVRALLPDRLKLSVDRMGTPRTGHE